jgi:hypothetical protein
MQGRPLRYHAQGQPLPLLLRKVFKEKTSSFISLIHASHYKTAIYLNVVTNFLSRKITLIAKGGCPPDRWGHGLQVMLEKVARVALVNKLRAILLMEADFNYMNRWVFSYKAINRMYAILYIPEDQYSQKESTVDDTRMDNRLTMDLSWQLRHPLATMLADADKCYDCINHILLSLLLLMIVRTTGNVVAMLHPIQTMKFFQRMARGDLTTFMGGQGQTTPVGSLSREWSGARMLADAELIPHELLQASGFWFENHLSHQWSYY